MTDGCDILYQNYFALLLMMLAVSGLDLRLRELSGVGRSGRSELGLVRSESGYGKRWQSQI